MNQTELAPGLDFPTFKKMENLLWEILEKEKINVREETILKHVGLATLWHLEDDEGRRKLMDGYLKQSGEVLQSISIGLSPNEVLALNVIVRKRKGELKELEKKIASKIGKKLDKIIKTDLQDQD